MKAALTSPMGRAGILAVLGWLLIFAVVQILRPLMPVDETRYLSVAWEMTLQHHWWLPTLNFEPYSHKPPLLFWLIISAWKIFGIHVWSARIVTFAISGIFMFATARLARKLAPEIHGIDAYAMLALCAMPMFLIYGSVIMFDTLMGVFVVLAMMVIWRIGQQTPPRLWREWLLLGAIIGGGILAKGPVALVYMLPAALFAPLWAKDVTGKWYAGVGLAVLTGAAIALAWAIPAVMTGGPEYGDKIFVTQSAGRMVNAFDHKRPFYFYVLVLIGYLVPFLMWPSVWTNVKTISRQNPAVRFILCWIIPVFIFFSAISSKQFHYMTPILPGCAILVAMALTKADIAKPKSVGVPMFLMLAPSIVLIVYEVLHIPFMGTQLSEAAEHFGYLHIVLSSMIFYFVRKRPGYALHGLCMAAFVMAMMIHIQMGQRFLPQFDLTPLANAIEPYRDRDMAVVPKYDGEYGYVLKLTHRVESTGREDVEAWFSQHPYGIVIGRYKKTKIPTDYNILFQQNFRTEEVLVIMEKQRALAAN